MIKPNNGLIFVTPTQELSKTKSSSGFGLKNKDTEADNPIQFLVVAVGDPRPFEGVSVSSPAEVGDLVLLNFQNDTLRDNYPKNGFMWEGTWYFAADFRELLAIIPNQEKRQARINQRVDELSAIASSDYGIAMQG